MARVRAAERLTGSHRRGPDPVPAVLAALLAVVLLADGAVVLVSTYASPAPLPPPMAVGAPVPLERPEREPAPTAPTAAAAPMTAEPAPPAPLPATPRTARPTAPAAQPLPRAPGALRLTVPALGVDADALLLETDDDGALEVPSTAQGVGWYAAGAVPGDPGSAVFAGHVDLDGKPGVFSRLSTMRPGQQVRVVRPDGTPVVFVVDRVEQHPKDAFPTDAVYGPTGTPQLRLITCGGSFDRRRGSYRDNVVVFASPA